MAELNLKSPQQIPTIEAFTFDPIKGYPMLHWKGKRPFRSTQYYPAQLKEAHGQPTDNWMNKIFWGDNLQVMSHLLKTFRGQVDLVYIDPPFDSKADYKKKISLKGKTAANDSSAFEEKQYMDIWSNDEYLQFIYERLILTRELLSPLGSIYLHCDANRSHHLRCLLEEVFGANNFKNEIIWQRTTARNDSTTYNHIHDTIFFYSKANEVKWNPQFQPYSKEYLNSKYSNKDVSGRRYLLDNLTSPNPRPNMTYEWMGFKPPVNGWRYSKESMQRLHNEGRIWYPDDKSKRPRYKRYLDEQKGRPLQSVWTDIFPVNSQAQERLGYPTQKPETLLERIIKASSNPGDLVFDCFMGSGTTQAVAMKLGRRFIGADINLGAIQTTTKRLLHIAQDLAAEQAKKAGELQLNDGQDGEEIPRHFTGFEVYNVNHYDVFRNPVEAKDLLLRALEIQPLPGHTLYDGEKDDRMVKIMPVNRLATRADLNELLTGFDYKAFEKKNEKAPGKPVEHLLLVCMGHEPDLAAHLREQVRASGFNIDVEVVDILRDKSNLEFKRDSEADITVESRKLHIRQFYPMNLL